MSDATKEAVGEVLGVKVVDETDDASVVVEIVVLDEADEVEETTGLFSQSFWIEY